MNTARMAEVRARDADWTALPHVLFTCSGHSRGHGSDGCGPGRGDGAGEPYD